MRRDVFVIRNGDVFLGQIVLIAAIGKNRELGKDNDLIWKFKKDMKFFRKHTMGKIIVMGRKTLDSLPGLLPNRTHIVLTHQNIQIPDVIVVHDKKQVLEMLEDYCDDIMIIGGASIYQLFIDCADKMLLTEIDAMDEDADVYFPYFDMNDWNRYVLSSQVEDEISFHHVEYTRKLVRR